MDFEETKRYWEERASTDPSAQSTTQDYFLREIELNTVAAQIKAFEPKQVIDIGCGDGRTTLRLAQKFEHISFSGIDYSSAMIGNGKKLVELSGIKNLVLAVGDVSNPLALQKTDFIYTTRCLINLPSWDLQKRAVLNIHGALQLNGHYVMVENFVEGHNNFNKIRENFGLPAIEIRDHNIFFCRKKLFEFTKSLFETVNEVNISSTYYMMSRVVYSKICQQKNVSPDYFDDHHRLAAALPFAGEFGPVRLVVLRKK